jgi:hypothetical protein
VQVIILQDSLHENKFISRNRFYHEFAYNQKNIAITILSKIKETATLAAGAKLA